MNPERSPDDPTLGYAEFKLGETEQSIAARFESIARVFPDRIAVEADGRRVTYRELDARADSIARAIVATCGLGTVPVVLRQSDDIASIASMLAATKAGKIFVPLDPAQPNERASLVIEDSGAPLLVSDARNLESAHALARDRMAVLDVETLDARAFGATTLPRVFADASASIIYTSGSTGRPKGVVQNHRNVLHNTMVHTNALRISSHDRLTLLSSRATGQAMTGIFSALLNGAALHPFNLRARGVAALAAWLAEDAITVYHSSASIFRELARVADMTASALRVVKLGSEPVTRRDVEQFRARFPRDCLFVNALSSTETGTICQYVIDASTPIDFDLAPVGYPVADVEVVLLDEDGTATRPGEVGEICVRSRYLATSYWNDPGSAERWFPTVDRGRRSFRTGDVGRMLPDGGLAYLGRRDFRVKIRGNRVEVTEVEAALLGHDAMREVAVVGHDNGHGGTRLVAYVVPAPGIAVPSVHDLRSFLAGKLPRHMIPSAFVFLEALPRGTSGKVDRMALPPWQARAAESRPPRDLLETQIADVWEELLGVEGIAINDDFFGLGGDSLLAVEMAMRIEAQCGVSAPVSELIDGLTIESLARAIVDRESERFRGAITLVQSGGTRTPFYFAHGAIASDGFYCRGLARAIGAERPFLAIQPHGFDERPIPPTIEEMAADRLGALLALRPNGPYLLGGFCAGGAVALEMARLLLQRGERVDVVVLIDAHANNARFRNWSRCVAAVSSIARLEQTKRQRLFRRGRAFLQAFRHASGLGVAEVVRFVAKKPYHALAKSERTVNLPPRGPLDQRQRIWLSYHEALENYIPAPYPGRVVLFRTAHLDERAPGDFAAGWRHVCDTFDVHSIAGDHRTCVTRHVAELGAKIKSSLDGAD